MKYSRKTFLSDEQQKASIAHYLQQRKRIGGKIPVTGRSVENYAIQLFPDIDGSLTRHVGTKDYLDVACGINPMYPKSLLCSLKGSRKKHGLDIHECTEPVAPGVRYVRASAYKTGLPSHSYDCITVNNFMYFWESHPQKLLQLYKEMNRLLKKGGTLRIFPVFYGNYACDNVDLHDYLNTHFCIQCLRPKHDYSKEAPVYIRDGEMIQASAGHGKNEHRIYHQLMAHVVILHKL